MKKSNILIAILLFIGSLSYSQEYWLEATVYLPTMGDEVTHCCDAGTERCVGHKQPSPIPTVTFIHVDEEASLITHDENGHISLYVYGEMEVKDSMFYGLVDRTYTVYKANMDVLVYIFVVHEYVEHIYLTTFKMGKMEQRIYYRY